MFKHATWMIWLCCILLFPTPSKASTVSVQVLKDGKEKQKGVGTVVANETVLTNGLLIAQGGQYLIEDMSTGAVLSAKLISTSEQSDLALLKVKGLQRSPLILAMDSLDVGRKSSLIASDTSVKSGLIHSITHSEDNQPITIIQHTMEIDDGDFGAPLLNNCGNLAGISRHEKKGVFDNRLVTSDTFGKATDLSHIVEFLNDNKIDFIQSTQVCISEKEQLARLKEEKAELEKLRAQTEEQRNQAEQQRQAREEELEKLRKESASRQEALEKAAKEQQQTDAERKKTEEALQAVQAEKEARERELKQIQSQKEAQQKELDKIQKEYEEKQARIAEVEKENETNKKARTKERESEQLRLYLITIPVIVILLIVLFSLYQRRKRLKQAQDDAIAKSHQLSEEKAKLESVQEELQEASATFSDIVLVGKDSNGTELRIKIIGNTLARSPDGLILGRSAQHANYVINDSTLSVGRKHFRIVLESGQLKIEDLQTVNGTSINGVDLIPGNLYNLSTGDDLRVAGISFKVLVMDK